MARHATVIGEIADVWGDVWDVREYRPTPHGFPVAFGWPNGIPRGAGGSGGPRVIVTTELARHFEAHRLAPIHLAVPIGNTAVKRIRRLLGHHRQIDSAAWWEDRSSDLADLTIDQFAKRHSVSMGAVANARHALFGHNLRPAGWWRQKDIVTILLSDAPRSDIADALEISVGSVGRLRWWLTSGRKPPRKKKILRSNTRPYGWTKEFLVAMERMIDEGMTAVEVSRQVGVTADQVRYAVRKGHLPTPGSKGPIQSVEMGKAVEMVRRGATYTEAARTFGFTATGVTAACKKAGVESPLAHFVRRNPDVNA